MSTTQQDKIKLLKLLYEREHRKRCNPINYFEPFSLQNEFIQDESKTKILFGGNRSGKTECVAAYIIKECLRKGQQRWWAVAETFQDSVNIQQRKIFSLLPKNKMLYAKYSEVLGFTNRKVVFRNRSSILMKSYDQGREAFQGDAVHGIWNDEEPPYDIYKEERMRLIDYDGEMLISMTSLKGMTDLMNELYDGIDILKSDKAVLLDNIALPRIAKKNNIKFYFLWTNENPYIPTKRLDDEIKYLTRDEIKSRIYGVPVNVAGRIYPSFSNDIHVIPFNKVPDSQVTLYHVLDPHDRKPWAMQWWAMSKVNTAYCVWEYPFERNFNEMESDDKTYDDYVKLIKDTEVQLLELFGKRVSTRIIDPNFGNATIKLAVRSGGQSHTTVKKEMQDRGLKFKDGIDSLATGHIQVKKWLHFEEKDGQFIVQPKCFIVDHCINTRTHLSRYSFKDIDVSNDIKDVVRPKEKYKDFSDCTRYFFMADPHYVEPERMEERKVEKLY